MGMDAGKKRVKKCGNLFCFNGEESGVCGEGGIFTKCTAKGPRNLTSTPRLNGVHLYWVTRHLIPSRAHMVCSGDSFGSSKQPIKLILSCVLFFPLGGTCVEF